MLTNDLRLALLVMEQKHREAEKYAPGRERVVVIRRQQPRWLHRVGELLVVAGQRLQQDEAFQA